MKHIALLMGIMALSIVAYAQTGINTQAPKSTLDVMALPDQMDKVDGILAPRLEGSELQAKDALYGEEQTGALIYVLSASPDAGTDNAKTKDVDAPGYYYFNGDPTINRWIKISPFAFDRTDDEWVNAPEDGLILIGKLSDGSTDRPDAASFRVRDDGNTAIGNPNNLNAKLNVGTDVSNSVVKLTGVSNSFQRTAGNINYNKAYPLMVDNNGNVYRRYNITEVHSNAGTFDGQYQSTGTNQLLVPFTNNSGSIVKFTVHSGFLYGRPNVGEVIYAEVVYSYGGGFQCSVYGYAPAAGGTSSSSDVNPMTIRGEGTQTLTFDFEIGTDLIFEHTSQGIEYRNSGGEVLPFTLYDTFISR